MNARLGRVAELQELLKEAEARTFMGALQIARREPGAPVIIPDILHWKLGHFRALVRASDGRFRLQTGHRSVTVVRRYVRATELFEDNAAAGIGL
jgi:hypothetical protein